MGARDRRSRHLPRRHRTGLRHAGRKGHPPQPPRVGPRLTPRLAGMGEDGLGLHPLNSLARRRLGAGGWPRDDRVTASAKTVGLRARRLRPVAHRATAITIAYGWRSQTGAPFGPV